MDSAERTRHAFRVISGTMRIKVDNHLIYIKSPSPFQRWMAEEIFFDQKIQAESLGAMTDEELQSFLLVRGLWTPADDKRLEDLSKDMENLKVELFNLYFRTDARNAVRHTLKQVRTEISRLEVLKHSYDHMGCEGIAAASKQKYLLCASMYLLNNQPLYPDLELWERPDLFSERVILKYREYQLSETDIREIVRNEPWSSVWGLRKYCSKGVFDTTVVDLTDEQKAFLIWSSVYDNIRENPENPGDDIIADDDMLDGWMIIKRRERDQAMRKKSIENMTGNDRIKNAQEVFVPVHTAQDASLVFGMNDMQAQSTFKQRMNVIKHGGTEGVAEHEMPDTKLRLRQQAMEQFSQNTKKH